MKSLNPVLIALVLAVTTTAHARTTIGSFFDGTTPLEPSSQDKLINTTWSGGGHSGTDKLSVKTGLLFITSTTRIFVTLPGLPGDTSLEGEATLTTIYGQELGNALLNGFNPENPEMTPTSPETHFGKSGQPYTSFSQMNVLGQDLPTTLVGFDLSPFDTTSNAMFYVFQTAIPVSEISNVPEPSAWILGLSALAGIVYWKRRIVLA